MKRWKGLNWRGLKREVTFQEFVFTQGTILKVTTAQNGRQTELFSRYCFQTPFSSQRVNIERAVIIPRAQNQENVNPDFISDQPESLVQKLSECPPFEK